MDLRNLLGGGKKVLTFQELQQAISKVGARENQQPNTHPRARTFGPRLHFPHKAKTFFQGTRGENKGAKATQANIKGPCFTAIRVILHAYAGKFGRVYSRSLTSPRLIRLLKA